MLAAACTNNPYPDADATRKLEYLAFSAPPKTLDPAVSYTTTDQVVIGPIYETLLEYHYRDRPYRLIPGLAAAVPQPEERDGRIVYRFHLRDDLLFQEDACFAPRATRQVVAADVAFSFMRLADPLVNSPVASFLSRIEGFTAFGERLAAERARDAAFAAKPAHEQYAQLGGIPGVVVRSDTEVDVVLTAPHPQLLYWFAMPFTAPVPWEAVAHWDGREGRDAFAEHPVGTGPFRLAHYDKQSRIVLERNPNWYGIRHPEWRAPGAVDPTSGRPLPFLEGVELRRDRESIPAFTKFLQGYYDMSGIIEESFDRMVKDDRLSPDMAARGMQLEKAVIPSIFYLGFNMDDPVVGTAAGERGRALRQAMSLAIDSREFTRIFQNGRGVPAESPLPPGIFGYDADYVNPYRQIDLERAAALLREAGYPGGIDPATGRPLHLTFDTQDTTSRGLLRFQYFANMWRRLGLDVEIVATTYNQFQDKVRRGAYQLFMWGWVADYPDPENFLFLLWSGAARSKGGPNTANFADPRYDALFTAMRDRPDDAERLALIRQMRALLETECPWIPLFHMEAYTLMHGWMENVWPMGLSVPTVKYVDVDAAMRARLREEWNEPIRWPLAVLAGLAVLLVAPAVRTYMRERR
ncbi:MAG TPA: ABC transporter substrate-binding protein [Candidatus Limnocylindria bacterium]|nr:ABC transporter substrate-binding protein [Candidatus Limnocylindria bacterium]